MSKIDDIVKRDGKKCHYCQRELNFVWDHGNRTRSGSNMMYAVLDHVIPRVMGGDNSDENMVLACCQCNTVKSSHPYDWMAGYIAGRFTIFIPSKTILRGIWMRGYVAGLEWVGAANRGTFTVKKRSICPGCTP